ncbi:MAG: hypothetical protein ACHP84_20415 [Caulobacterales bacterium]
MRTLIIVTTAALVMAGAASAQPIDAGAPAPSPEPPKYLRDAGYTQRDITPGLCRAVSSKRSDCVIPGMTAGIYQIEASETATATGDGAVLAFGILIGGARCIAGQTKNADGATPWTSGPKTLQLGCIAQIVADNDLIVSAESDVQKATLDPKGPLLSFRALPWSPIVSEQPFVPQAAPAPAPARARAPAGAR